MKNRRYYVIGQDGYGVGRAGSPLDLPEFVGHHHPGGGTGLAGLAQGEQVERGALYKVAGHDLLGAGVQEVEVHEIRPSDGRHGSQVAAVAAPQEAGVDEVGSGGSGGVGSGDGSILFASIGEGDRRAGATGGGAVCFANSARADGGGVVLGRW